MTRAREAKEEIAEGGATEWSNGMSERSGRGGERKDILRRDSRNSYSCLTTTRRSIMQRLAFVRGDARAVGNAREPARFCRHLRILTEPGVATLARRIGREDGSIIQRTREEIELCPASSPALPPARQAHFSSFSSLFRQIKDYIHEKKKKVTEDAFHSVQYHYLIRHYYTRVDV